MIIHTDVEKYPIDWQVLRRTLIFIFLEQKVNLGMTFHAHS